MLKKLNIFWLNILLNIKQNIRQLSGEDAYERYLISFAEHQKLHAHEMSHLQHADKPLTRKAFFKQWQDGKWTGIKRCC